MRFTYNAYEDMLSRLVDNGYEFSDYLSWENKERPVILRHDIDYDLEAAVRMAKIEYDMKISATYFVLVTSDLYNIHSKKSHECIMRIMDYGHSIGLHFDEMRYSEETWNAETIIEKIKVEAKALSEAFDTKISTVSMHRPSKNTLEANIEIEDLVNSYSTPFFKEFKYLSDSRRRWREPVDEIINSNLCQRLHILTHPFWYNDKEQSIDQSIRSFINCANRDRYMIMDENITDLSGIMKQSEIR